MKNEIYLTLNVPVASAKTKHYEIKKLRKAAEKHRFTVKVVSDNEVYELLDNDLPYAVINMSGRPTTTHLRLLRELESRGCKTVNPTYSASIADDKMLAYIELKHARFPVPKTLNFDVLFNMLSPSAASYIEKNIGFPCVIKIPDAGLGLGVHRVMSIDELHDLTSLLGLCNWRRPDGNQTNNLIIQEYIPYSEGRAVRVLVIGGKCLGAFCKTNRASWKTATFDTGKAADGLTRDRFEMKPELEQMSIDICKHFNLGCAGIDYLFTETGFVVCEINTSPNMRYFDELFPELDTSALLIEYLLNKDSSDHRLQIF
jgi:gamma-F420-2:alpha-L-glutamate ligase